MPDKSPVYIGSAFVAGICLAFVCKELLDSRRREKSTATEAPSNGLVARPGPPAIVEGIEGCIGNTPLFRIKSLSDETGCEILAKAEVCNPRLQDVTRSDNYMSIVSEWRRSKL